MIQVNIPKAIDFLIFLPPKNIVTDVIFILSTDLTAPHLGCESYRPSPLPLEGETVGSCSFRMDRPFWNPFTIEVHYFF